MTPEATRHAETLAHAVTELLRYAREGAASPSFPFGMDDIVAGIAEVLAWSLDIETTAIAADEAFKYDEAEAATALRDALRQWLTVHGIEVAL